MILTIINSVKDMFPTFPHSKVPSSRSLPGQTFRQLYNNNTNNNFICKYFGMFSIFSGCFHQKYINCSITFATF